MAKPNAPKEIKPEGEKENKPKEGKGGAPNTLVINLITTIIICCVFLLGSYFMIDSLLSKKMQSQVTTEEGAADSEENAADTAERGIIIDLGEFTMNLSDSDAKRYLKASVALELTKTESDLAAESAKPAKEGHGEGAPAASPLEAEMAQYKPAIRDAVISALSSKTSAELSTTAGKELAKEEIADSVDSIFGGEREVIRVSFGDFIMQ